MATYLDGILAWHRERAGQVTEDLVRAARTAPPVRSFADALSGPRVAVIAEVKRRSPSRGPLVPTLDPAACAAAYETGGASALSVLTDEAFFGGSPADLRAARAACELPVLRKDFTVCPADCLDARAMGADAVLLIVAALGQGLLESLVALAGELGLDALVECHDRTEVERAVDAGARIVGVNQRDLATFAVDAGRAAALREAIPSGVLAVAESGISGPEDVARLTGAGYDAVLVGEALVVAEDRAAAVGALVAAGRGAGVSR